MKKLSIFYKEKRMLIPRSLLSFAINDLHGGQPYDIIDVDLFNSNISKVK